MVHGALALAALAAAAGCYSPKLKNFGFACDSQAPKPCPDGYFCNNGFCDDGTGGSPPAGTGGNAGGDMSMSQGGAGGGGGGGSGGGGGGNSKDMAMASIPDMAMQSIPDMAQPRDMVVVSTCAHSECTTGTKLVKSCSPCATAVCNADSLCCTSSTIGWDSTCVSEVATYCAGIKTCP